MRRAVLKTVAFVLTVGLAVIAVGLTGACSDDEAPADDGSVKDSGARECSEELFCSKGVVEEELEGDGGRCLRRRVYTCKEGCKVFSATTTQPAMLCNEGPPDSGPTPDRGADGGAPADDASADLAGDVAAALDLSGDVAGAADLAGDVTAADAG